MPPADDDALASLSDIELRERLHAADPEERCRAAWVLGLRAAGTAGAGMPSSGVRRQLLLTMTVANERDLIATVAEHDPDALVRATACQYLCRLVNPEDHDIYELLVRLASAAEAPVLEAIAANVRTDAPVEVQARLRKHARLTEESAKADIARRYADRVTTSAFLRSIADDAPADIRFALALVREHGDRPSWSDVPHSLVRRHLSVLVELARLFADRHADTSIRLWLACALHCRDLVAEEHRDVLATAASALLARARSGEQVASDDLDLFGEASRSVVRALPELDHVGYTELFTKGLAGRPREGLAFEVMNPFARLWVALVNLAADPDDERYRLHPRYK